jgi:peptide/nickel transport system permease protein
VAAASGDEKIQGRSLSQIAWRRLRKDKIALTGGCFIIFLIVALLLRISDHARRPPPELIEPDEGYDADATQVVRIPR